MARTLDASHFRPKPRTAITALPRITKLASGLADAVANGLNALRPAPWRIASEGISEEAPLPADGDVATVRFESEQGSLTALIIANREAISAMIEVAMGGTGIEPPFALSERPLSRIETRLLKLVQTTLARAIAGALGDCLMRPFSLFEGSDAPELDRAMDLAQFRIVLNVFGYSGEIVLALAREELERQIILSGTGPADEQVTAQRDRLQNEVGKSEVTLLATLAPELLTLDAIASMQPGKFIPLRATAVTPVTIWSGGVAAYQATLGRNGDRFAVTISASLA